MTKWKLRALNEQENNVHFFFWKDKGMPSFGPGTPTSNLPFGPGSLPKETPRNALMLLMAWEKANAPDKI